MRAHLVIVVSPPVGDLPNLDQHSPPFVELLHHAESAVLQIKPAVVFEGHDPVADGKASLLLTKAGLFPQRFRLGKASVGWHLAEVEKWLRNREPVFRQTVERKAVRRAADRYLLGGSQVLVTDRDPAASIGRSTFSTGGPGEKG